MHPTTIQKWLLGGFSAFVPAVAVASYFATGEPALDEHLCVVGRAPQAHHVVLADRTDPLGPDERRGLTLAITRLQNDDLKTYDRLSIWEIGRDERGPAAVLLFDKCLPPHDVNPLYGNRRRVRERFAKEFEAPLAAALDVVSTPTAAARRTPLLQALHQIVTASALRKATGTRVLWVFSDLLEHSDRLSMYGARPFSFDAVRDWDFVAGLEGALAGVDVHVRQLTNGRAQRIHTPSHTAFWKSFWRHTKATKLDQTTL